MKRIALCVVVLVILGALYSFYAFSLKQTTISSLSSDISKIKLYSTWGFDTTEFEKLYGGLVQEAKSTAVLSFPFQDAYFKTKHDTILRLAQAGYATEVSKQKGLVQGRLAYIRDRVKTSTSLPGERKQYYFDVCEVVAGNTFESNTDLTGLRGSLEKLEQTDSSVSAEIESIKKESVLSQLTTYKRSCEDLYSFFTSKDSSENILIASNCINKADQLMSARYVENGADYIQTLAREQVFTAMQKAQVAKQQLIQDEAFALAVKKKEEEKLTLVPPAPRQDGKVVVVNLALQRLYAYENGKSIFDSAVPITTGKYGFETVTGEFAIYLKKVQHQMVSPFPGIYYDDVVNYWMPFYLGYGLHDAPWRSIYGTQDYPVVGSHGCVNMPLNDTIVLYNWAEVGTRVIVI